MQAHAVPTKRSTKVLLHIFAQVNLGSLTFPLEKNFRGASVEHSQRLPRSLEGRGDDSVISLAESKKTGVQISSTQVKEGYGCMSL